MIHRRERRYVLRADSPTQQEGYRAVVLPQLTPVPLLARAAVRRLPPRIEDEQRTATSVSIRLLKIEVRRNAKGFTDSCLA